MNEALLAFARGLEAQPASIALHESIYMYPWVETTHVLALALFLGLLCLIDLRMLGLALTNVPARQLAARLDPPMLLGFAVMVVTGALLYYAIPVRTTQSLWFRIKVPLLLAAGINAWWFRRRIATLVDGEDARAVLPTPLRRGAARSLVFWAGVVLCGRFIAYDWFDCDKLESRALAWACGCVDELAAMADET